MSVIGSFVFRSVVEVEMETTIVHWVYRGLYRDNAKWNGVYGIPSEHGLILIFAVYRVWGLRFVV